MRTGPFWTITQRVVVTRYRRFGITSWSFLQGSRIQRPLVIFVGRVGRCSSSVLHRGKTSWETEATSAERGDKGKTYIRNKIKHRKKEVKKKLANN